MEEADEVFWSTDLATVNRKYVKEACVGKGTYGKVFKALDDKNTVVAIKVIQYEDECDSEVVKELTIMQTCSQHDNIAKFYKAILLEENCEIWIIMEYCGGGSVAFHCRGSGSLGLEETWIQYIGRETCKALDYLHRQGILQRDVKCQNLMLTSDSHVKMVDFGISTSLGTNKSSRNTFIGTPFWMAPEVIQCANDANASYNHQCDVWSLGITCIEMAEGNPPLHNLPTVYAMKHIVEKPGPKLLNQAKWSGTFHHFLSISLDKDPLTRPTTQQLLQDLFFTLSDSLVRRVRNEIKERILLKDPESSQDNNDTLSSDNTGRSSCNETLETDVEDVDTLKQGLRQMSLSDDADTLEACDTMKQSLKRQDDDYSSSDKKRHDNQQNSSSEDEDDKSFEFLDEYRAAAKKEESLDPFESPPADCERTAELKPLSTVDYPCSTLIPLSVTVFNTRIILGTALGLFYIDATEADKIYAVTTKRSFIQIEALEHSNLLICICGRSNKLSYMKLTNVKPKNFANSSTTWTIENVKNCLTFSTAYDGFTLLVTVMLSGVFSVFTWDEMSHKFSPFGSFKCEFGSSLPFIFSISNFWGAEWNLFYQNQSDVVRISNKEKNSIPLKHIDSLTSIIKITTIERLENKESLMVASKDMISVYLDPNTFSLFPVTPSCSVYNIECIGPYLMMLTPTNWIFYDQNGRLFSTISISSDRKIKPLKLSAKKNLIVYDADRRSVSMVDLSLEKGLNLKYN